MSVIEDYREYFKPDDVPDALLKLLQFDEKHKDFYSQGFEIDGSDLMGGMLRSYSDDPGFLNCFRAFAQADGTGSTYAVWRMAGTWSDAPIVAFGSEGGVHIVANNLLELLRILTLDAEPMIDHERVVYYRSDGAEPSSGATSYSKWLEKNFDLKPVADADEVTKIVASAQRNHQKALQKWMTQYYRM